MCEVTEGAAAVAAYLVQVRSRIHPVTMTLTIGSDYDNVRLPRFRDKSWNNHIKILKYEENFKYPANFLRNFCPAVGSIVLIPLRYQQPR